MIDKSKAMRDYQLTEEQYDEMLGEFVTQAEEAVSALESAVPEGRTTEAADVAHSLKGVAGNLRLDDCYAIARDIELALKGNVPGTVESEISNLKKAVEEIRSVIKNNPKG
jgi:HPt (histidine-containing phosphotransfer) domain-containing protein